LNAFSSKARGRAERGQNTGCISKVLSQVSVLFLLVLLIHLVKAQQWLGLGVLITTALVPSRWVRSSGGIGTLIVLCVAKDWIGAIILIGCVVTTIISVEIGWRNARKALLQGQSNVSALEGINVKAMLIAQMTGLAIGIVASGVMLWVGWSIFALAIVYQTFRYAFRLRSPWSRVHYPLMLRWAHSAGVHSGRSQLSQEAFDEESALIDFAESINPEAGVDAAVNLVAKADDMRTSFGDEQSLRAVCRELAPQMGEDALDEFLRKVAQMIEASSDLALRVRFIIAEVIEQNYGARDRARYIHAVLSGKAH
jgi:hypothetical protein